MRPIDFVLYGGDSEPSTPVYLIADAMQKPITVFGPTGEFVVYGYYYDAEDKRMVLEIKKKVEE
jgi:RPA family protein